MLMTVHAILHMLRTAQSYMLHEDIAVLHVEGNCSTVIHDVSVVIHEDSAV